MSDPFVAKEDCQDAVCFADAGDLHEEGCASAPGQMTVAQLRFYLSRAPNEAVVDIEGCDCVGKAYTFTYTVADKKVLIGRWPKR